MNVHGRFVGAQHVGPVAGVVAPGAGHAGGVGGHGAGAARTKVVVTAWSGAVVVGGHAAVATHVVAVHGGRRAHRTSGRGHVGVGLLAEGATVGRGPVGSSHEGRSSGLGLLLVSGLGLLGEEALAVGRAGRDRAGAADTIVGGLVGEEQRRAGVVVARGGATVFDALALDTDGRALVGLTVELGDGNLGHVRLSILDKGHGTDVGCEAAGGVQVGRALNHVDLEDLAGCTKELLQMTLLSGGRQVADEDGTTVALAVGEEGLIAAAAGGGAILLQIEGSHTVDRVVAESLREVLVANERANEERGEGK